MTFGPIPLSSMRMAALKNSATKKQWRPGTGPNLVREKDRLTESPDFRRAWYLVPLSGLLRQNLSGPFADLHHCDFILFVSRRLSSSPFSEIYFVRGAPVPRAQYDGFLFSDITALATTAIGRSRRELGGRWQQHPA